MFEKYTFYCILIFTVIQGLQSQNNEIVSTQNKSALVKQANAIFQKLEHLNNGIVPYALEKLQSIKKCAENYQENYMRNGTENINEIIQNTLATINSLTNQTKYIGIDCLECTDVNIIYSVQTEVLSKFKQCINSTTNSVTSTIDQHIQYLNDVIELIKIFPLKVKQYANNYDSDKFLLKYIEYISQLFKTLPGQLFNNIQESIKLVDSLPNQLELCIKTAKNGCQTQLIPIAINISNCVAENLPNNNNNYNKIAVEIQQLITEAKILGENILENRIEILENLLKNIEDSKENCCLEGFGIITKSLTTVLEFIKNIESKTNQANHICFLGINEEIEINQNMYSNFLIERVDNIINIDTINQDLALLINYRNYIASGKNQLIQCLLQINAASCLSNVKQSFTEIINLAPMQSNDMINNACNISKTIDAKLSDLLTEITISATKKVLTTLEKITKCTITPELSEISNIITQITTVITQLDNYLTGNISNLLKTLNHILLEIPSIQNNSLTLGTAGIFNSLIKVRHRVKHAPNPKNCVNITLTKLNTAANEFITDFSTCQNNIINTNINMIKNGLNTIHSIVDKILELPLKLNHCLIDLNVPCLSAVLNEMKSLQNSLPINLSIVFNNAQTVIQQLPEYLNYCVVSVIKKVNKTVINLINDFNKCSGFRGQ